MRPDSTSEDAAVVPANPAAWVGGGCIKRAGIARHRRRVVARRAGRAQAAEQAEQSVAEGLVADKLDF